VTSSSAPPGGGLVIPEVRTLRELRGTLARGGLPAPDARTATDSARITGFRVVTELLRLFEELRRRHADNTRYRIVEREHAKETGRLILEFEIVEVPP